MYNTGLAGSWMTRGGSAGEGSCGGADVEVSSFWSVAGVDVSARRALTLLNSSLTKDAAASWAECSRMIGRSAVEVEGRAGDTIETTSSSDAGADAWGTVWVQGAR